MFQLSGKHIVVIGASRGIGLALVEHFVKQGANVTAAARTHSAALQSLPIRFLKMDISSDLSVKEAFDELSKCDIQIDVLINNAGISGQQAPIDKITSQELEHNFNTNVLGITRCLNAAYPLLCDGASVINTASLAAHLTVEDYTSYSISKAAVVQLTKNVAMQWANQKIRVNSVSPGTVLTAMEPEDGPEAILCKALTALGKPADVTQLLGTYHFLASDASQYITGTDIRVDGGWIGGVTNKLADVLLS
ncbi:SDR family NAD(P)-dependent oxidoreductase [Vibrio hangzhouensis]|uniref:SDR family NAD(P)-dependent oxidoreductase n=1 Tax=Vibrio hangzhouensis TaxID=462991 RepID=UPI001C982BE5|nr:SDR family oxidoreductase [Vibrio hangzhouensis]MBY6196369.1 SDR family oxidoreductase [Vibrio hangzhouensis]